MPMAGENAKILCVDLDGTLVKSDTLVEMIVLAVKKNPFNLFAIIAWMAQGKSYLKHRLAGIVQPDVEILPYHKAFVDFLHQEKAKGRQLVLVTASNIKIAQAVADHLGIFDDVIASDEKNNLRGGNKVARLNELYGKVNYSYAGNDHTDFKVWQDCHSAVVVNDGTGFLAKVPCDIEVRFSPRERSAARNLLKAVRPHQWAKNILILVPLLISHQYGMLDNWLMVALAFVAFTFCASGVYLVNDILDMENDRRHEKKCRRPFASGELSPMVGAVAAILLFGAAGLLSLFLMPYMFSLILLIYFIATCLYSFWIKTISTLDVVVLAGLYTSRVLAGAAAIQVVPSFWLLAFSMFIFLSLAFVKRYCEVISKPAKPDEQVVEDERLSGRGYSISDKQSLFTLGSVSGIMSVLIVALYINDAKTIANYQTPEYLWLMCPVLLYWINRVWIGAARGKIDQDPIAFALKDRVSLLIGVIWVLLVIAARYGSL